MSCKFNLQIKLRTTADVYVGRRTTILDSFKLMIHPPLLESTSPVRTHHWKGWKWATKKLWKWPQVSPHGQRVQTARETYAYIAIRFDTSIQKEQSKHATCSKSSLIHASPWTEVGRTAQSARRTRDSRPWRAQMRKSWDLRARSTRHKNSVSCACEEEKHPPKQHIPNTFACC